MARKKIHNLHSFGTWKSPEYCEITNDGYNWYFDFKDRLTTLRKPESWQQHLFFIRLYRVLISNGFIKIDRNKNPIRNGEPYCLYTLKAKPTRPTPKTKF